MANNDDGFPGPWLTALSASRYLDFAGKYSVGSLGWLATGHTFTSSSQFARYCSAVRRRFSDGRQVLRRFEVATVDWPLGRRRSLFEIVVQLAKPERLRKA